MATPLDFGLLSQFQSIFPFILVFTVTFVILTKMPFFKDSKTFAGIAAFVLAVMSMFSPLAVRSLNLAAPWFVIYFIFLLFILIGIYTLGIEEKAVIDVLKGEKYSFINILSVTIMLVIVIGSIGKAVTEQGGFGPGEEVGQEAEFYKTFFHPKVLGVIFIMLIAFFTIMVLGRKIDTK